MERGYNSISIRTREIHILYPRVCHISDGCSTMKILGGKAMSVER